jgi:cell division GTPase FtsZ
MTDNTMATRYQRGNQKSSIEDEEILQCQEMKKDNDLQNITQKAKDRATRIPLQESTPYEGAAGVLLHIAVRFTIR